MDWCVNYGDPSPKVMCEGMICNVILDKRKTHHLYTDIQYEQYVVMHSVDDITQNIWYECYVGNCR